MRSAFRAAAVAALALGFAQASLAQSSIFDFEDGTDQGFGTGFGNDASASFPIDSIGGSLRMRITQTASFQEAGREGSNPADPYYQAMLAASGDEANYVLSYDWYVDTTLATTVGSFLQLATYVNSGDGYYAQDFPGVGKDVELSGTQLASGQVFSGTVAETFTAKGFDIPAGNTFFRIGFIANGDGNQFIHFDNIRVYPVPEPTSLALIGLAIPALAMRVRRRSA